MNLMNYSDLMVLVFTFIHTDIITTKNPKFKPSDVDMAFTSAVQRCIHPLLLRTHVLYKLPYSYSADIEIDNPLVSGNSYLPGTMYFRINMFSDMIPLCINLLKPSVVRELGTYKKVLLRRFCTLQSTCFNYWNQFLELMQQDLTLSLDSYSINNLVDRYFCLNLIHGLKSSVKLPYYLNYRGDNDTIALSS